MSIKFDLTGAAPWSVSFLAVLDLGKGCVGDLNSAAAVGEKMKLEAQVELGEDVK